MGPQESEAYAMKLGKRSLKAGYMYGLSGGGEWQRRYFVLKPATLLYSFGSIGDEEPLGCVDVEGFVRCECGGIEMDGSVVIELVRDSGQALKLKANDTGWLRILKKDTYSRVKEAAVLLRKQRDDFASEITRLEDVVREAKTATDVISNQKDALEHELNLLVTSITAALMTGSTSVTQNRLQQNQCLHEEKKAQHSFPSLLECGMYSSTAAAVRRLVDERDFLKAMLEVAERRRILDKDTLEASSAALAATLAVEQRKTRALKHANAKLNVAVLGLTKQRRTLCAAIRKHQINQTPSSSHGKCVASQKEFFVSETGVLEQRLTNVLETLSEASVDRERVCSRMNYSAKKQWDNNDNRTLFTPLLLTEHRKHTRLETMCALKQSPVDVLMDEQQCMRRDGFKCHVKEVALTALKLGDFTEQRARLHATRRFLAPQTSSARAHLIARCVSDVTAKGERTSELEHFNAWLDSDDEDRGILRLTFVRQRLGVTFMPTVDGGIKVTGITNDYDPDLPHLPQDAHLVAINGHPLVFADPEANLRALKHPRRPLILDFDSH
mmetsp:Transcript_4491/g.14061  ORF Transcript_4491/g.14061 Transcript_4491/m.14061 type:complete len:555 (-) Transcript_4491:320-1984(-)|eukprot:CAMPEP_0198648812 /NCGR_PEP_ID=MMETSP1467-20131203/3791_1 /TAXON_ID=1462469 /ORGANISM="unid. sp., Strain CCMP2135" /LENGTH=554 /DNA_ID=CAMNT_0044384557 /DNA_START=250 /DNA_END=1914 /DNA_ORIENTATION=+